MAILNFQLNKNAANASTERLVKKNGPHRVYARTGVELGDSVVATHEINDEGNKVKSTPEEIEDRKEQVLGGKGQSDLRGHDGGPEEAIAVKCLESKDSREYCHW
jgi:hypothetical protein